MRAKRGSRVNQKSTEHLRFVNELWGGEEERILQKGWKLNELEELT